MSYSENVSKKLNELLEKNYDAEKGYKLAAEKVNNQRLKSFSLLVHRNVTILDMN